MNTKLFFLFTLAALGLSGCSGPSTTNSNSNAAEDSSASGAAASSVGGAINNSSGNGTVSSLDHRFYIHPFLIQVANASTACPTLKSTNSSGANTCSSTSNVATLHYSSCSFGGSAATWTGFMEVSFSGSTTLSCGTFPTPTTDTMLRQFVASSGGAAGTATRTSALGNVVTIDDTTSGIQGNYQLDTFNGSGASGFSFTAFNSGGGKEVVFNGSGKRSSVTIAEHLAGATGGGLSLWDHTVAGTVNLSESGSGSSTTWTATSGTVTSGTCSSGVTVYHNKAKVMGTTCFESVTYSASCCTPTSGTIVTSFSTTSRSGSGLLATAMNGKSESLTFNGCGSATYTDYAGTSSTVTMGSCF